MTSAGIRYSVLLVKSLVLAMCLCLGSVAVHAQAQVAAADLRGTVVDPNGAVVPGATITARNIATGISRTTTSGDDGSYVLVALQPGEYEIIAEAATFKKVTVSPVRLTVGQSAELRIPMELGAASAEVTISGDAVELIETSKTTISTTIDEARIDNLPINERSATGFALTISTVGRDNGRPIGPAPTSGLNIGGQRGRSTQVNVDGADFTDNSINASRSTVSQEAVQEYQVTTNSYLPEFGRATGGIVNVVTKSGTNEIHGNLFGFLRHKSIQEKNALAPVIDGDPDKKPPYTRTQYGATFGAPIIKDRNFVFFSFEQRRRQETGFFTSDVIGGLTESASMGQIAVLIPGGGGQFFTVNPAPITFTRITAAQAAFINSTIAAGLSLVQNPLTFSQGITALCGARTYGYFASSGGTTALNGSNPLLGPTFAAAGPTVCPLFSPTQATGAIGSRFLLTGTPVPLTQVGGEYVAFRPLTQLRPVFPISEATTYTSFRMDHLIEPGHQLSMRFSYNPSVLNGIQDESQNQVLGQNDYSRTGIARVKDTTVGLSYTASISGNLVNEAAVNFGRRWSTFDSQVPSVAQQIPGTAFMGSNPFSPVERTEERWQIRDNLTWVKGNHIFKTGADFNWIDVKARFELNFPALFNFNQQACSSLIPGCTGPAFTAVQTYGLGIPSAWIQGFGDPNSRISNKPIAFYVQDTWKIGPRFTLNYGVRYDIELTEQFAPTPFTDPLTGISLSAADIQAAQDALNVTQGFPRDKNNWAPRVGFAWDVFGSGRTLVRAAGGIFFDHPLLAVAFNSDIADGSQQQQATLLPIGGPLPTTLFNATQVFQGTVVPCNFPGAVAGINCTPGVAASAQYLQGFQRFNPGTFSGFGPVLPFTLHVSKDFEYPMAFQGNLGIEQMIGKDMVLSANYITVNAKHLAHPQDVNSINVSNLKENFRRFVGVDPTSTTQAILGVSIPTSAADPRVVACPMGVPAPLCFTNMAATWAAFVPGLIAAPVANLSNRVVSPVAANFFRPIGPNYFFIASATNGAVTKATWDALSAGSVRTTGPITAYGEVNAQLSDGNSTYNALNVEVKKRFASNAQFFATYTWSHSIDDSSDLQTLLKPQDNNNFRNEKANSLFDQRHRFVFSGVFGAPESWRSAGGFKSFAHGFVLAPIVEFGSGRPFNILAVGDATGDNNSSNERPSVLPDGTLCQTGVDPGCFIGVFPATPNLGRNMGITHNFFSVDLRVSRKIPLGERWNLELIGEVFNMFDRFNEAGANPFYQVVNAFGERSGGRYHSSPTAAYDPRQFQFGVKLSF